MSQARLPRTEPSTALISAHKVNHRAAHVAARAPGIFAGAGSHRVTRRSEWESLAAAAMRVATSGGEGGGRRGRVHSEGRRRATT